MNEGIHQRQQQQQPASPPSHQQQQQQQQFAAAYEQPVHPSTLPTFYPNNRQSTTFYPQHHHPPVAPGHHPVPQHHPHESLAAQQSAVTTAVVGQGQGQAALQRNNSTPQIRASAAAFAPTPLQPQPTTTPNRSSSLLLAAYAKALPPTQHGACAPFPVLFEYCRFLIDLIEKSSSKEEEEEEKPTKEEGQEEEERGKKNKSKKDTTSAEAALALLSAVELAFTSSSERGTTTPSEANRWEPSFIQAIRQTLTSHPALQDDRLKSRLETTLETLPNSVKSSSSTTTSTTANTTSIKMSLSTLSGIAGRIPPSEDGGLSHLLADLGPACTRSAATFREVLAEVSSSGGDNATLSSSSWSSSSLHESALAHLIFFFSQKTDGDASSGTAAPGAGAAGGGGGGGGGSVLSPALLGSLLPQGQAVGSTASSSAPGGGTAGGWNLKVVAQVLNEDYGNVDWNKVAQSWDFPGFMFRDTTQFRVLLDLYRAGAGSIPPIAALTRQWNNTAGQLSFLEAILGVPPAVYSVPLNEEEMADASTAPQPCPLPNPQCWASLHMLSRLLYLSDVPSLYRRVRDLFVKCLLQCPEVLLCSLVRMQLRVAAAAAASSGGTAPNNDVNMPLNAGLQLKQDVMRELIPLFFRHNAHHRVQNAPAALRRLYVISPPTVNAACVEAWRSTANRNPDFRLHAIWHIINIGRLMPNVTEAITSMLSGKDIEFNLAMAFCLQDRELMPLKPWLVERLSSGTPVVLNFAQALIAWLRKYYSTAQSRAQAAMQSRQQNSGPDSPNTPLLSIENLVLSIQLLRDLDSNLLAQAVQDGRTLGDAVSALVDAVLQTFPALRPNLVVPTPVSQHQMQQQQQQQQQQQHQSMSNNPNNPVVASDDVEEMATQYFQKIYTSEQSIGEVVDMLKRFKTSGNAKENEIFACMVHNLFDEYRFFAKYPDKELRITGILFGALIQEQLVSSITLGIALRYVLEALRKPPSPPGTTTSSGKMFNFGMFALEQFKGRLHEWPQYCSHIVQIPHLKETRAELVAEIEVEMAKSQSRAASGAAQKVPTATSAGRTPAPSSFAPPTAALPSPTGHQQTSSSTSLPQQTPEMPLAEAPAPAGPPRVAEFGPNLGRAVTEKGAQDDEELEAPPGTILDRVQFMINNMAPSNVEQKAQELKDMLDPTYFPWLGHFLVVKRISTQANFHSLYLSFLDHLGDYGKGLVEAILQSAYHNIGKLLRSPKITTSSSERSFLKNLGIFLGQISLARNRPILQIMLDCKELLLQGYETGKLIAVAPFLAKTLEGAKNSVVFRPPNPWLMGILGVFRSVYNVDGLKMNIKFEVEVLCKNLGIKLEDIPLRNDVLSRRIAPAKERNPDFNIKSTQVKAAATAAAPSARAAVASPEASVPQVPSVSGAGPGGDEGRKDQETVIPNLAAYVSVNPTLPQLLQQGGGGGALSSLTTAALKRWVPLAVDKAIREIIQPVVERSVTIACITTKEIVTKDFAMESDELKMRKAGQLMVANLAGSLALVTCREPLRSSVSQHLRRLLTENIASGKLVEQEQNIIEQCVQICATDNLELGCMLIEKAATEKAVKDVDEALAPAMNARRTHREQTGQPFYDMSIFSNGNQHYPAALPEQLQPKPGGLRAEHFQLYESFQRMSRPSQGLGSMAGASGASAAGSAASQGVALSPARTPATGQGGPGEIEAGLMAKQVASQQQFSTDTLSQLASKLDSAVTSLLSAAGQRAPEIKLAMLPPEHQIRQLLSVVKQLMPNAGPSGTIARPLTSQEQELVLSFSQSIFKRLYELSLGEPLRLEALVALLENINAYCPKLGKDMGTWSTYAPSQTEQQRRLHRTVLLLLVRSRLLAVPDLDSFLAARTDNGRNHTWVEFSLLFIRTAFLERISTPADFPKLMDLMTRIVEGRSQATAQVMQVYRKNIVRMLEENGKHVSSADAAVGAGILSQTTAAPEQTRAKTLTLAESSSLSPASLAVMSQATAKVAEATEVFVRKDPPNARQQVTTLLDGWIRLQSDSGGMSDKALAQYLQVLQRVGVGKVEEHTERFLRLSALVVVDAVLKSAAPNADGPRVLNHTFIDMYARLLVILFRHMNSGANAEQVNAQRLGVLNKILGSIVRSMMWHYEKKKAEGASWDQRPWFRLLLNLVIDLNKPDPAFEPIRLPILSVFGVAFHMCQPLAMPGFAFAWLELISHRHFLPNLMLSPGQKGWNIAHQLLVDHLLFLEPYLGSLELTAPIKKLYEGTLRVLLVLLHDFPSFLAGYHLSFCNVIPDNSVQLRNIILSATPKGMNPPDPFTPNLKIDLLSDIGRSPAVLSNVLGPIESIRGHLDAYLKDGQRGNFLAGLLPLLYKDGSNELDVPKVNSLVVYVGAHALARLQNSQISLSRTPEMEVIQKLMELDDRGRYICLNAIANQLRYPSSHTHYFSCVMLYLFSESKSVAVKEQVTRVLLERLIVNRPHPWGLLITFIELIKNQRYGFWNYPFTRCATEIEKVFESVARSTLTLVGGATVEMKD